MPDDSTLIIGLRDVPKVGRVAIVGDATHAENVTRILNRVFGAQAFVLDPAGDGAGLPCDAVVAVGPRFRRDLEALARWRVRLGDCPVYRLPLPVEDMWGWYDFCLENLDVLTVSPDGDLCLPDEAWAALHVRRGSGTLTNEGLSLNEFVYLHFQTNERSAGAAEIANVLAGLEDEESRWNYTNFIAGTPQERWRNYSQVVSRGVQYFDRWPLPDDAVIINCGLLSGFELPYFGLLSPKALVLNIDPLGDAYLSRYARDFIEDSGLRCVNVRTAASDEAGEIELPVGGPANAPQAISKPLPESIKKTLRHAVFPRNTIDAIVRDAGLGRVDLIKMDIEGGELPALVGAMETIEQHRPALSISVYHTVADNWLLPDMLIAILGKVGYRFFYTAYSYERWEAVLYCVPQERL